MTVTPLLEGLLVTIGQLQRSFGPVAGAVMGYGEGEFGEDGRLQWCASVLPGQAMSTFLNRRRIAEKAGQRDPDKPFLILMGSLKRAQDRGGVPNALFGIGLAAPVGAKAETILHPHHLARPENIKDGHFRWPVGVPLLRAWLSNPPAPFSTIIGQPHRAFGSSDGNRVVPLDQLIPGLVTGLLSMPVQEAVLDRPFPLRPFLAKLETKWREGRLRDRTGKEPVRDPAVAGAALAANLARFGTYRCEECAYEPAKDTKVPCLTCTTLIRSLAASARRPWQTSSCSAPCVTGGSTCSQCLSMSGYRCPRRGSQSSRTGHPGNLAHTTTSYGDRD